MSPVFAHGQLRLYLLALLDEAPRHGYEVIRALEERSAGTYSPSAGTVYPRLARLEEEGLVIREAEGRKAVYRITGAGRAEVADRRDDIHRLEAELTRSLRRMAQDVRDQVAGSVRDLRADLDAAARSARRDARRPAGSTGSTGSTGSPSGVGEAGEAGEAALAELDHFRAAARRLLRDHSLDDAAAREVHAALERALSQIRSAVQHVSTRRPS